MVRWQETRSDSARVKEGLVGPCQGPEAGGAGRLTSWEPGSPPCRLTPRPPALSSPGHAWLHSSPLQAEPLQGLAAVTGPDVGWGPPWCPGWGPLTQCGPSGRAPALRNRSASRGSAGSICHWSHHHLWPEGEFRSQVSLLWPSGWGKVLGEEVDLGGETGGGGSDRHLQNEGLSRALAKPGRVGMDAARDQQCRWARPSCLGTDAVMGAQAVL